MKKNLIAIVGKTSTGKDTLCNYLKKKYGISQVCSYTTRPKRKNEENGVQHYFVSDREMDELEKRSDLLAWTQFPNTGYRYCATLGSIKDAASASYIINPDGVDYLLKNAKNLDARLIIVFLNLDEKTIRLRAALRGDNPEDIEARIASEKEQFDCFYKSRQFDYEVDASKGKKEVFKQIDAILLKNGIFKN